MACSSPRDRNRTSSLDALCSLRWLGRRPAREENDRRCSRWSRLGFEPVHSTRCRLSRCSSPSHLTCKPYEIGSPAKQRRPYRNYPQLKLGNGGVREWAETRQIMIEEMVVNAAQPVPPPEKMKASIEHVMLSMATTKLPFGCLGGPPPIPVALSAVLSAGFHVRPPS